MDDDKKKAVSAKPGADLSGRRLGGYRLLRRLGRGAMAEVYLAEQTSLKRQVAVKVLKSQFVDDRTSIQRFQREAEAAAALVHANIVQIHEVDCVDGIHFIAQEYVQGQNLRQWMSKNGLPGLAVALGIMRQAASALAKAAEHGIVHRDIKPENILLTRSGEVKVADFGLARRAEPDKGVDLTQVGITMGTPLYMSPEQAEGQSLDPRSDLYSLGVTFYHLLSGSPPFLGESALAVAVQHIKTEPARLEKSRPDLPHDLCRIVHKMLAKKPQDRYLNADELLRDLRQLQLKTLGHPWPEELANLKPAMPETADNAASLDATQRLQSLMQTSAVPARRSRRRWAWAAAWLGAFLVGAVFAFFGTRQSPLLADAAKEPTIPRRETALRQWMDAAQVGTEAAWQAVVDYWPDKPYLVHRAQQQLARIHLHEGDHERALLLFRQLAALPETESELRAFGLAGHCGVLSLQGHYRESAEVLNQLWPLRKHLTDPQMQQLLRQVVAKNRHELGQPSAQEWDSWLSDQFGATPVDAPASMR